ncbi:MAG: hypothetical protein ACXWP5_03905 [Bdellovibrionota bacterium]
MGVTLLASQPARANPEALKPDTSWRNEPVCSKLPDPASVGYAAYQSEAKRLFPGCAEPVAHRCDPHNRIDLPQGHEVPSFLLELHDGGVQPDHFSKSMKQRAPSVLDPCPIPAPQDWNGISQVAPKAVQRALYKRLSPADKARDAKLALSRLALRAWEQFDRERKQDLESILTTYQEEGISSEMSEAEMREAVDALSRHVLRAAHKIKDKEEAGPVAKYIAQQFDDAAKFRYPEDPSYEGFLTVLSDQEFPKWQKNEFKPYDQATGVPEALDAISKLHGLERKRFEYVRKIASAEDHEEDYPGDLTPYHAKMLLLFHLRDQIYQRNLKKFPRDPDEAYDATLEVLNRLALKLNLKRVVGTTPGHEWEETIAHDGFYLSAPQPEIVNLFSGSGGPNAHKLGASVDCSTFFQQVFRGAGFKTEVPRLSSNRILEGALKQLGTVTQLTAQTAQTLEAGDVLVESIKGDVGHVLTVAGFAKDPPIMILVDAAGGYSRTIVKHQQGLFEDFPRDCKTKFLLAPENGTTYYKFSIKKAPQ